MREASKHIFICCSVSFTYTALLYSSLVRYDIELNKIKSSSALFLKYFFKMFGLGVTSYNNLVELRSFSNDSLRQDQRFMQALNRKNFEKISSLMELSKSQLKQDLFVLWETNFKKEGYFVEFGATNGIDLSNTYLLETEFSWKGILAEPAIVWRESLYENRPNAAIETLCVWKDSTSTLTFNETDDPKLSTVDIFSDKDAHRDTRQDGKKYEVQTISLNDLLKKHKSPRYIDYLSIDTEGSEFEILKEFDFNYYDIQIITVEHNFSQQRELIFKLLTSNSFKRVNEDISNFDDWYIKI